MLTFSAGHQIHNIVSLAVVLPIQWHRFVGLGGFGHLGWSHIGANLASLLIAFMQFMRLGPSGPSQCLHCTMWRWWRRSDDGMWPLRCAHQDNVRPRWSAMFSHGGLSVHFWRTALSLVRYFHAIDGTFRCLQLDIKIELIASELHRQTAVQWSGTEEQLRICWNSFLFWSLHFWHL